MVAHVDEVLDLPGGEHIVIHQVEVHCFPGESKAGGILRWPRGTVMEFMPWQ